MPGLSTKPRRAAAYCRRTFGRQTYRERIARSDLNLDILLDAEPVIAIGSVELDGVALDPTDYEVNGRYLFRLRRGDRCSWHGRGLVVIYQAGWFLPSEAGEPPAGVSRLPVDVERAVVQLVGVAISAGGRDAMVKGESVDGVGSTSWYVQGATAALPHPEAEAALADYRRLVHA